ncbi:MAG: hypothetical protein JRI23_33140 [Deltaproteobacteria bacterium]|nr:hypothetical protein [Deltaproteobacteria bacterium]
MPRRALLGAESGSSLPLRYAEVVGHEGGLLLVSMGREAPYAVHPGYVIAPQLEGRLRRGSYVLAPYRQQLRHGVVVRVQGDGVQLQYTDLGFKAGVRRLQRKWVAPQPDGLAPGNFAVARRGGKLEHLLLVSSGTWGDGTKRWLALGHGTAATLVDEASLQPLSLDFKPKAGEPVLVQWLGTMVPAEVVAVDPPGLFRVERPEVAPGLVVGADLLLPAPATSR